MSKLVALVALLAFVFAPSPAAAAIDRTSAEILADYTQAKADFDAARRSAAGKDGAKAPAQKMCELTLELAQVDPQNAELAGMYSSRWALLATLLDQSDAAQKEIAVLLTKNPAPALATEARWSLAQILMREAGMKTTTESLSAARAAVDAYVEKDGADKVRAPELLANMAELYKDDPKTKLAIYKQLIERYGDTKRGAYAKGKMRQLESMAKPFELSFTDAIGGKKISIADLKGKVVVVDFWATWCGPCVKEMPTMKELYAKYKDKGVEFIGVSLDKSEAEGGLAALKGFVEKNGITWPQYYQGNWWASEFSSGWGINSIPCVFVVDQKGNLVDMDARGKLESVIPALLGKSAQ